MKLLHEHSICSAKAAAYKRAIEPGKFLPVLLLLFLSMVILLLPVSAQAAISLTVSGDGVSNPRTFSEADLLDMELVQQQYSTINTWPTKKMIVAQGVRLSDILEQAGITDEAKLIKVKSRDGFVISFTVQQLLDDTRYFYPGLKENHEYFGYINGSEAGASPVPTIIALKSAESTDFGHMNDKEAPLLVLGQRWISEQTNQVFVKMITDIEVSTSQPGKWDKPTFSPSVGEVPVGTLVELSTTDMDGDNIYYTLDGSDPGIESPIYNWIKKRWWKDRESELASINRPIEIKGNITIKAVAIGFGKEDSDIISFDYQVLERPPELIADSSQNELGQGIDISFIDDPAWRAAISDVKVNDQSIAGKYTLAEGIISIDASVFTQAGDYEISVLAPGYVQARVSQNIGTLLMPPPELNADSSENEVGQGIDISFIDDPAWRAAINDVKVNEQSIAGKYTLAEGIISIDASVFTQAGDYDIRVWASGYTQARVNQNVTARVVLQNPVDDQEFSQGQKISIQGIAKGVLSLNLKIVDPQGEVVYGPVPLTIIDERFESSYSLSSTAKTGVYNIVLEAPSLSAPLSSNFRVKSSTGGGLPPDEDVVLTISGDGVSQTRTFTLGQLEKMEQHQEVYSVINTWPTKKWYVGEGVLLDDLLDEAGIKSSASLIKITSMDGYSITLTASELLHERRYCFPRFKEGGSDADGHIPGSSAGKRPVEAMIALISAEGTDNPSYMDDLNSLLFMVGQRAVTEQTGNLFVKKVNRIEVSTTTPPTWDIPRADPGSGEIEAGTLVKLSNNTMDDDKIYYTTDGSTPTLESSMYNPIASRWWTAREDDLERINHAIEINEDTTIKAITIGPGKKDSKVATFTYRVKPAPSNTTGTIKPNKDNTISLGNEAKLDIPANTLATEVEVSIRKVDSPPAVPGGFKLLSSVFELEVDGKSSYKFKGMVSLTLKFDPAQLEEGQTPSIFYYDDAVNQWINLGGTVKGSTITVQIDHFSKFAVMARELGTELSDISGHWAQDNIQYLLANKVIGGYPDGSFKPDKTISRAEFVTILVKAFALDRKEEPSFADTENHWAKDYIATAVGNSIANGYNENSFGPDDLLTREQMAVMILNASQLPKLTAKLSFSDQEEISPWAREALAALTGHGVMKGYPDNSIQPQGQASRAEAVTVIVNTLKLVE